ncbi:cyd operon YbgE family protein [Halomonas sp. A11-A]|uniref:cyd operon YbgE family protein n=1 Tax=Halomonas sp. A11-A TaxID=2183985 RepID=UPI000D826F16|nr:cyd operon YbgE family protein [Halomonas sp. A11-A]PWV70862.1 Cyd operon protein YbgE [Halomonas sp. A11-A]
MRIAQRLSRARWEPEISLLVAAFLAVWLLLEPALIQGLPLGMRLPAVLLGIWALGAAFVRPLGLSPERRWQRRLATPPWSLVALGLFAGLLLGRALLGG